MKVPAEAALAIGALVLIGTLEAAESARQLEELARPLRLRPAGAGLTALGAAASALVYLALGWWRATDRDAVRLGALTGASAGAIGGTIRVWLVAPAIGDAVGRYAVVPEWFIPAVLALFVALATVVSAAAGAALAFAGVRIRRLRSARSRRLP